MNSMKNLTILLLSGVIEMLVILGRTACYNLNLIFSLSKNLFSFLLLVVEGSAGGES